jgi:serine/threonine-protein kinase RsbW
MAIEVSARLPASPYSLSLARALCRQTLVHAGAAPAGVDELALALTEACTHVLRQSPTLSAVEVDVAVDGDECRMSVCGVPSAAPGPEPAVDRDELVLLRALVDRLQLRRTTAGGRCVTVARHIALQPPLRLLSRA